MNDKLLTREEFKKQVFAKTNGKCCVPGCNCDAVDAHHIMDRKLWKDGGYYITNGYAVPINWSKSSRNDKTKYTYSDGTEIEVSDGRTYIEVQTTSQNLTINE